MIGIRPFHQDEGALLDDLFDQMSPRSRYLRFHAAVPVLTASLRRALLEVDGWDHLALVAEVDGSVVGIVRLFRDRESATDAEVSIAVVDAWHRRGVGRKLLKELARSATQVGVTRLHAVVLPWNRAALRLFRSVFPGSLTRRDGDVINLVCLLSDVDDWEITMDDVLSDLIG